MSCLTRTIVTCTPAGNSLERLLKVRPAASPESVISPIWKRCAFAGKVRLHAARHEVDAEDRADHAERIRDRVADRWIAVLHHLQRRLQCCGAGHRAGEHAERMANLDSENVAEPERDQQAGSHRNQREEIVFAALGAGHPLEELPPVENADSVEKHDQPGEPDRSDDVGLRREGSESQVRRTDGADAKRKPAKIDLSDQVSDPDREKNRKDRLRPESVTGKIKHGMSPAREIWEVDNQRTLQPAARNWPITRLIRSGVGVCVSSCSVGQAHRLPLEGAELVERLDLHPLDIFHGRHKSCDAFDIGRIVGMTGHQREANPDRLAKLREPFVQNAASAQDRGR